MSEQTGTATKAKKKPSKAQSNERKHYWVGVFEDSPFQNITLGGINFQLETAMVTDAQSGKSKRIPQIGSLVELSDEQVKKIKHAAETKRARPRGAKRSVIVTPENEHYREYPGEQPIGRFVYMVPAEVRDGQVYRPNVRPTPLVD